MPNEFEYPMGKLDRVLQRLAEAADHEDVPEPESARRQRLILQSHAFQEAYRAFMESASALHICLARAGLTNVRPTLGGLIAALAALGLRHDRGG